jgi:hypothetical protein
MKTDAFVTLLATGEVEAIRPGVLGRYACGAGLGALFTTLLTVNLLGIRPDLSSAIHLPMFWVKLGWVASLAITTLVACMRLSQPGRQLGWTPRALLTPMLALWALAAISLFLALPSTRNELFFGRTWSICPFRIAALSVPVFIGSFWALHGMAPTRLRLAGAAAGLLSGAIAAFIYALHCPEMAAPFLGVWYPIGMVIPTTLGALLGTRLLHW